MSCKEAFIPYECHLISYDLVLKVFTYEIYQTKRISFDKNFEDREMTWDIKETKIDDYVREKGWGAFIKEVYNTPRVNK
jgi:hypothetical protein